MTTKAEQKKLLANYIKAEKALDDHAEKEETLQEAYDDADEKLSELFEEGIYKLNGKLYNVTRSHSHIFVNEAEIINL